MMAKMFDTDPSPMVVIDPSPLSKISAKRTLTEHRFYQFKFTRQMMRTWVKRLIFRGNLTGV